MPPAPHAVYCGDELLLPETRMIGHRVIRAAHASALTAHTHPDCYEVCLIVRGEVDWWVGRELYHVSAGQLFVTRPGEVHGGIDGVLHRCELFWVQVKLDGARALPGMTRPDARRQADAFACLRRRLFPATTAVHKAFVALVAEHARRDDPWSHTSARAALHGLLIAVLRDHDRVLGGADGGRASGSVWSVERARRWMLARLSEPFTVADAAAAAGLSVSQFHHRFVIETGMTPHDWCIRQRVARARHRLREGSEPVTALAMRLGFSTSQYFATTFKRVVGLTPTQYRSRYGRAAGRA